MSDTFLYFFQLYLIYILPSEWTHSILFHWHCHIHKFTFTFISIFNHHFHFYGFQIAILIAAFQFIFRSFIFRSCSCVTSSFVVSDYVWCVYFQRFPMVFAHPANRCRFPVVSILHSIHFFREESTAFYSFWFYFVVFPFPWVLQSIYSFWSLRFSILLRVLSILYWVTSFFDFVHTIFFPIALVDVFFDHFANSTQKWLSDSWNDLLLNGKFRVRIVKFSLSDHWLWPPMLHH